MSCEIKIKSLDFLKEKGAIGKGRVIQNIDTFNELNDALTLLASEKYGIVSPTNDKLFKSESKYVKNLDHSYRYILRAEPNEKLFNTLQVAVDNYSSEDNILENKIDLNDLLSEKEPSKLTVEELNTHEPFSDEDEHGTINEFILFSNQEGKKSFTAVEILENIINNYTGFSEIGDELVQKAKYLASVTKAKVKIINEDNLVAQDTLMQYHPDTNTISISLNRLRIVKPITAVHGFLHEVVHSVTVNAIVNPVTAEQRMFSNFIEEAFKQYKKQESLTAANQYGFTNSKEFVAEIFTNVVFQNTIKSLDATSSLWKQFIDFIRTLVGLPKTKDRINYNNVIEEIVKIAPTEQVFNKDKHSIFEFKNEEIKVDEKLTSLKTLDEKLEYTINKIEESLKSNIESLEWQGKKTKDEKRLKTIEKYVEDFNVILSEVKDYRLTNQIQAVAVFVSKISANMNYIKTRLDKLDYTDKDEVKNVLRVYSNYLSTFSVVNNIEKIIVDIRTEVKNQDIVTEADLSQLETVLKVSKGEYSFLEKRMYSALKKGMAVLLNDIKYFKEVETKHRDRLRKEHSDNKLPKDTRENYIIDKMQNRDKDLIQEDLDKAVLSLMEDPSYDVMGADVMFSSAINVSSPLVQIMNQILYDIKNEKNEELQIKNRELVKPFEDLVKEKGSSNPNDLYKNILQYDSKGQPFFLSDYNIDFYEKVHVKSKTLSKELKVQKEKLFSELNDIRDKKGLDSLEYFNKKKEIAEIIKTKEAEIKKLKDDNVIYNEDGTVQSPSAKWKTDYSKLSEAELNVLNLIKERLEQSHKDTPGQPSLINYSFGTKFYELPKITKSDFERLLNGDGKNILTDKYKDLTETRPDDVGYYTIINTDLENNRIYNLKVHYRDASKTFDHKNQSLDIMNLIRLETENGTMFRIRKENEFILHSLIEIAKNKDYYQKEGTNKQINFNTKKYNIVNGKETNTYKMMNNMIEQKFYDMFNKSSVKLNKLDLNKAVKFINSSSAFLTLSLNIASGTANVINANAQLFLESFLPIDGGFINASGIVKANRMYGSNMTDILQDLTNPINKSFVNQINEMFDINDSLNLTNSGFLRTNMVKAGFSRESLQVFQTSGEHWIQSVTVMAVLDGIKALNKDGKYIDKEGKEVSKKKAASLLDMLEVDKVDGIIKMSDKVVYTTHSRLTKWGEGGKTNVDMLIRKKLYDTVGNYTQLDQPDIMRHWGGKLGMLYRKYFISMGQARLRGWETSLKLKENLTDDEKRFSYALQEYEEGTYVTLARFVRTALKDKHYWLLSKPNWDNLSDYEKHNIKRAVTEMALVYGLLPLLVAFIKGIADGDDDEYLFFLAYQIRRLDTELSQYQSLSEMFKMMRSPIPSARLIETVMSTTGALLTPWNLGEEYEAGPNKGKNKFTTKIKKQIPVLKEFQRTYEGLLQYQESTWGSGL